MAMWQEALVAAAVWMVFSALAVLGIAVTLRLAHRANHPGRK